MWSSGGCGAGPSLQSSQDCVEKAKESTGSTSTLHLKFHAQLVCLERKEKVLPPHLWASEGVEVDPGAHKEPRGQWRGGWCGAAQWPQSYRMGMPNSAEKYSVWGPSEIQMPLWGEGLTVEAGVQLNPTLGRLGVPSMQRIPIRRGRQQWTRVWLRVGCVEKDKFLCCKKGKQGEEQFHLLLIPELRGKGELSLESSFKMRLET